MKKVAIITITNSGLNFGNRLQNYALQEKLKQYGVHPETICSAKVCGNSILLSRVRKRVKGIVKKTQRSRYFKEFDKKYMTNARIIHYGKLNERVFSKKYQAFIAGSDQVWNPNFHFNSEFEFLTFATQKKRYSYAASFGVEEIPDLYIKKFSKYLKQLRTISVREDSGRLLVKKLTGREARVHIDPTMLLTKEEYKKIEEKPSSPLPKRYLLMYFLGEVAREYRVYMERIAKKEQLEIVQLSELSNTLFYHIGPQHFLYLFDHAQFVCTDSFHGTVFSILFERQFTVFQRHDNEVPMNSRINTLLGKMHLEDCLFKEREKEESRFHIDYMKVRGWVKKEQVEADKYLSKISRLW